MTDDIIHAQYDITKKSKLRAFYESKKKLIFLTTFFIILIIGLTVFYINSKKEKKILLSENYVTAKIYLENGNKEKSKSILREIVFANDATYSTLAFFLILNQELIDDERELIVLFDHILKNNNFDQEIQNLLIYKKAVFASNFITESELLNDIKPLLKKGTLWKPHALLLLGDYFSNKSEYIKAKEFYGQVLQIKNLKQSLYDQAIIKLSQIDSKTYDN
jgi:hypothetical protein